MTDLAFGVLLVTAGAALHRLQRHAWRPGALPGARYGRELYVVVGSFLVTFGLWEVFGAVR